MSIDEKVEDLIKKVTEQEKIRKTISSISSKNNINNNEITSEEEKQEYSRRDTIVENSRRKSSSNSSSDSPKSSNKNSNDSKNKEENNEDKNSEGSDSSLENLMINKDLNFKTFTLVSCLFCIATTSLSFIISLILERLLTFDYGTKIKTKSDKTEALEQIKMNYTMIYILLSVLCGFNIGLLILIAMNKDSMLKKMIYLDLKWYFVLTQFAFGSLFLITLIWDTDLWTINVCLSIAMLTISILAFYFKQIKQKKNMTFSTFVFINIYISVLFSFISYVTLYNLACIIMENLEGHKKYEKVSYKVIKITINGSQTVLSFVLLTYYKDVFFAYTSAYIECAVFIHENIELKNENIAIFTMVISLIVGIILTICRYGKKTFGFEDVSVKEKIGNI